MQTLQFDEMLVHNADFLKSFASRFEHDKEAEKDLLQDTLYKALVNKEKYKSGTNIKAWLYTIMRNTFINGHRRNTRIKAQAKDAEMFYAEWLTAYNDVHTQLEAKELRKAIYQLPKPLRHPFLLYFEGYKYEEIAGMLEEPVGTIKSRIHFAKKRLKLNLHQAN